MGIASQTTRPADQRRFVRARSKVQLIAAASLVVAGAAGCSGSVPAEDIGAAATPVVTAPAWPPSASVASDSKAKPVLLAYEGYWIHFLKASNPPNPKDAALAKYLGAEELTAARTQLEASRRAGTSVKGSYSHVPSVSVTSATQAVVLDCLTLKGALVDVKTGRARVEAPPTAIPVRADMALTSGSWKIMKLSSGTQACGLKNAAAAVAPTPTRTTSAKG